MRYKHKLKLLMQWSLGVLLGLMLSILGFFLGGVIGGRYGSNFYVGGVSGWEAGAVLGSLIFIGLGSALGVYLSGKFIKRKCYFKHVLLWSLLGVLIDVLLYNYKISTVLLVVLFLLPPSLAMVGFYMRKWSLK